MQPQTVQILLSVELKRAVETDKESENLATAIETAVNKLDGYPGLMGRLDSAFPGVLACTVIDFTTVEEKS